MRARAGASSRRATRARCSSASLRMRGERSSSRRATPGPPRRAAACRAGLAGARGSVRDRADPRADRTACRALGDEDDGGAGAGGGAGSSSSWSHAGSRPPRRRQSRRRDPRAVAARAGGAAPRRRGKEQSRDRVGARDQRAHRCPPPPEHLREARRLVPHRSDGVRVRERSRLKRSVVRNDHGRAGAIWWIRAMSQRARPRTVGETTRGGGGDGERRNGSRRSSSAAARRGSRRLPAEEARPLVVILDASERIGDPWRQRWPSLRLYTPAKYDELPGMRFPARAELVPQRDRRWPTTSRPTRRGSSFPSEPVSMSTAVEGRGTVRRQRRRTALRGGQRRRGHRRHASAGRARLRVARSIRRSPSSTRATIEAPRNCGRAPFSSSAPPTPAADIAFEVARRHRRSSPEGTRGRSPSRSRADGRAWGCQ